MKQDDEERYNSRSTRRKRINYRELNGSDNENDYEQTCVQHTSSRGRLIKRTELHSY